MSGSRVGTFCALLALATALPLLPRQTRAGWFDRKTAADESCQINCGEYDHCQRCTQQCRKQCHSTWYPRVAPYCQPGWGWTQPCWRRAEDTYNCPPVTQPASAPSRKSYAVPEAPAAEPEETPPHTITVPPRTSARR